MNATAAYLIAVLPILLALLYTLGSTRREPPTRKPVRMTRRDVERTVWLAEACRKA